MEYILSDVVGISPPHVFARNHEQRFEREATPKNWQRTVAKLDPDACHFDGLLGSSLLSAHLRQLSDNQLALQFLMSARQTADTIEARCDFLFQQ